MGDRHVALGRLLEDVDRAARLAALGVVSSSRTHARNRSYFASTMNFSSALRQRRNLLEQLAVAAESIRMSRRTRAPLAPRRVPSPSAAADAPQPMSRLWQRSYLRSPSQALVSLYLLGSQHANHRVLVQVLGHGADASVDTMD